MCPDASVRRSEDAALSGWALPATEASPALPHSEPRRQEPKQEVQEPGGGVENQEQDGADVHRRRRGGDDRPVVRCSAALQALLPGEEKKLPVPEQVFFTSSLQVWPLFAFACQASGLGGTAVAGHDADQVETMKPVKERVLKITFNADRHASMQWNFKPQQTEIFVRPGSSFLTQTHLNIL